MDKDCNVTSKLKRVWLDSKGNEHTSEQSASNANVRIKVNALQQLLRDRLEYLFDISGIKKHKTFTKNEFEEIKFQNEIGPNGLNYKHFDNSNISLLYHDLFVVHDMVLDRLHSNVVERFINKLDNDTEKTLKMLKECLAIMKELKTMKANLIPY